MIAASAPGATAITILSHVGPASAAASAKVMTALWQTGLPYLALLRLDLVGCQARQRQSNLGIATAHHVLIGAAASFAARYRPTGK